MKVYIQNFRCFKEKKIEFPNGNISLLKGESGKGKSTVLQSVLFALFGNMRNIYPLDFKPSSTNQTVVTLEFPNSKLRYITRSQPPEQIKVYIKKDIPSLSKDIPSENSSDSYDVLESEAAQRYIESVFGTKDIWYVSSYLAQGERSPLMTNSNSDKINLLCEILFGNKFNSELENYQNPDWYSSKIEKEMNDASSRLTCETTLYNVSYKKYMEFINNYKAPDDPKTSWSSYPTSEALSSILQIIQSSKIDIQESTKKMLDIKGKEKDKEFLDSKLLELQNKIKALEAMNSSELTLYLQKTREEIKDLESAIQDLNTQYLNVLVQEQKKEFIESKIQVGETKRKELLEANESIIDVNNEEAKNDLQEYKSNLTKLQNEAASTKLKESEYEKLKSKYETLKEAFNEVEEKLSSFKIQDIEHLRKIIQNTKSFMKLKDLQNREPENITISHPESELLELQIKLPNFVYDYKLNNSICISNNIQYNGEPTDSIISKHLEGVKKLLDFVDTMKKELDIKEKHDKMNIKINSLKDEIVTLNSTILEEEKKLDMKESMQNIEYYISMKTEIQMNTGDNLLCPDCNISLEIKSDIVHGPKLCKLTKPRYSKEEGKVRIEILNNLTSYIKNLNNKKSELEYAQKEKDSIVNPKPEFITDQVVATYTSEFVQKYKKFNDDFVKYKFGVKNDYNLSLTEAEELVEKIPKVKLRLAWEKEFTQAKQNLSIDSSLPIIDDVQIKTYESYIVEIPTIQNKKQNILDSIKETQDSFTKIYDYLKVNKTSKDIEVLLSLYTQNISDLENKLTQRKHYDEITEALQKLKDELFNIFPKGIFLTSSENIKSQNETLKSKCQILKETLSGYSQYEVLAEDLTQTELKLRALVIDESSESLSLRIETLNKTIETQELYHKNGVELKDMYDLRASLEQSQKKALDLSTEVSTLNRLKMLVLEVTNSSLQNLVDSINDCTNNILEDLFENNIKVELKLFKEHKKTNGLKPQINFSIFYNNNVYDNIMGLSGGEKDRISLALTIALACVNPSPVLFLDECLSTVGNDLRECALESIRKFIIAQTGKTCIIIQHSIIEGHCDAVVEI
jgi:DNA repair exonuclease SbcCD ATPase subunit